MIRVIYDACKWGVTKVQGGVQLNVMDEGSGHMAHIPFTGDALRDLIHQASAGLSPEQKRELAPLFTSGIILPQNGELPEDFRKGPQG